MSSSPWPRAARFRRALPWILYAAAALAAVPLARRATGFGAAPAVAEARRITVACPRTPHRLWVKEVLVSPGEAVAAGQVLARMAPQEVDVELAAARRELEALELEALRTSVAVGALAAEERRDRSELAELRTAIAREAALVADHLTDARYLGELQRQRAGLEARARELGGALLQARRSAEAGGERLAQARRPGGEADGAAPRHAGAGALRAAAAAQREQVRALEALRGRLELRAPAAARVEAVLLQAGEVAGADGAVLTLVEERPRSAIAWVDERWATRVRAGDRVRLAARGGAGPAVHARVTALAPAIAELPARFWLAPSLPRHGRAAYLELDEPAFLPGQALEATLLPAREEEGP